MKIKVLKIISVILILAFSFNITNVKALYKEDFTKNQEDIKKQNKIISKSNEYIKVIIENSKLLKKEFNDLGTSIRNNKDLKNEDKQLLIVGLNETYKKEIAKYNLANKQVKEIKSLEEFKSWEQKDPYLSVLNYKKVFDKTKENYQQKIAKKMDNLKTVIMIFTIIAILIVLFIIVSLLNILIEKIRVLKYKNYLNNLIWKKISQENQIKVKKGLVFRNELNNWICINLQRLSKEEQKEEIFEKNVKIIKILEQLDIFNKKTKDELEHFYIEFIYSQLITKRNNFFAYVKDLTQKTNIDLSSKKFSQLKNLCQNLEKNINKLNLDIPNLIWYTKNENEDKVNLHPYAMFSFTPKFLKISTEELEFEVSFEKIKINANQQLYFEGNNTTYYINIDQNQKIWIQNYLQRTAKIILEEEL